MGNDYERLFGNLKPAEPPEHLFASIISQIKKEKTRQARRRLFLHTSFLVVSGSAFMPAFRYFISEFHQSGFYQYLSLIFSDGNLIVRYWQDFTFSLLESLPAISGLAILAVIFIFLISLRNTFQNARSAFSLSQLT